MGSLMSNEDLAKNIAQMLRLEWPFIFTCVRTASENEKRSEGEVWDDLGEVRMLLLKRVSINVARNWFEQVKYYCGSERMTGFEMLINGHVRRLLEVVKSSSF